MSDLSRRDLLAAGGGIIAGGVGGVAVSPSLRRVVGDFHDRLLLPQSPIKAILSAPAGLMVVLTEEPQIDSLNVVAPDGTAAAVFKPKIVEKREYVVEWSELSAGRYRVLAVREREIIQDEYIVIESRTNR